jgi:hypothetical protein
LDIQHIAHGEQDDLCDQAGVSLPDVPGRPLLGVDFIAGADVTKLLCLRNYVDIGQFANDQHSTCLGLVSYFGVHRETGRQWGCLGNQLEVVFHRWRLALEETALQLAYLIVDFFDFLASPPLVLVVPVLRVRQFRQPLMLDRLVLGDRLPEAFAGLANGPVMRALAEDSAQAGGRRGSVCGPLRMLVGNSELAGLEPSGTDRPAQLIKIDLRGPSDSVQQDVVERCNCFLNRASLFRRLGQLPLDMASTLVPLGLCRGPFIRALGAFLLPCCAGRQLVLLTLETQLLTLLLQPLVLDFGEETPSSGHKHR